MLIDHYDLLKTPKPDASLAEWQAWASLNYPATVSAVAPKLEMQGDFIHPLPQAYACQVAALNAVSGSISVARPDTLQGKKKVAGDVGASAFQGIGEGLGRMAGQRLDAPAGPCFMRPSGGSEERAVVSRRQKCLSKACQISLSAAAGRISPSDKADIHELA